MTLHQPMMLVLLALLPLIWWRWLNRPRHAAIRFSSLAFLGQRGPTWAVRARNVIPLLRTVAVALLIVCLARPQKGNEQTRIFSEGVAIQLIVDRSGSMRAMDFAIEGRRVDRLTAIKNVVNAFVAGDDDLEGRDDDLIGMIAFAGYADSKCPLTLDHGYLLETLDQTEIVSPEQRREEDGTAIGDAVALGAERLRDLERRRRVARADRIKSKVMILLTDGENNAGDVDPLQAAQIAQAFDIRIYTIGVGTKGTALYPGVDPFGRRTMIPMRVSIDEDTLRQIADATGGQYFRATNTHSLRKIYAKIDELEKTKTEEKRYMQYTELATHRAHVGPIALPPLLLVALTVIVAEVLLANTRFRKIP